MDCRRRSISDLLKENGSVSASARVAGKIGSWITGFLSLVVKKQCAVDSYRHRVQTIEKKNSIQAIQEFMDDSADMADED